MGGKFDNEVAEEVKRLQEGDDFQKRMVIHCKVVYEEGLKKFGCSEVAERTNKGPSYPNRWKVLTDSLVADRRKLRKDLLRL